MTDSSGLQRAVAEHAADSAHRTGEDPRDGPLDLLVIGDAVPDVIVGDVVADIAFGQAETLVERGALTVGGSSAIMACGAARLGLRVAFVGAVGDDSAGRFMREELSARGVDVSGCVVLPGRSTGLTVHLVRPGHERDRAMLTSLGCVGDLTAADVPRALVARARHVHVGSFFLLHGLAPGLASLFAEARRAGHTTSLDTQGDWSGRWQGHLRETLHETDVYLPNLDEALAASAALGTSAAAGAEAVGASLESLGALSLQRVLRTLAGLGLQPVIKCGAQGAVALDGDTTMHAAALRADPVDTIGAGDSFDAGFVCGYLQGWPVSRSLGFAAACGSLSTRAAGGVDAQPTVSETLEAIAAASTAGPIERPDG
jgi:sugar/nucleoside kinase (ribokinase family)